MFKVRIQIPDLECADEAEATKVANDFDKILTKFDFNGEVIVFEEDIEATDADLNIHLVTMRHEDKCKKYEKTPPVVEEPVEEPPVVE